jgi:hypothetical protein
MCGEFMHLKEQTRVERVAGTQQSISIPGFEWQCPECDYFEEADPDDLEAPESV